VSDSVPVFTPPAPAWVRITAEAVRYTMGLDQDVYRPTSAGARLPVVVMVHGCCGDRADLGSIPAAVAMAGAVVYNADWGGLRRGSRFPSAYAHVGCAVAYARATAPRYGGDSDRVTLLGWSDGALAAAVVSAGGWRWVDPGCAVPNGRQSPDALVGVAGFYGWPLPVPTEYAGPRAVRFLGGTPASAPKAWTQATPYGWLGSPMPRCVTLLVGRTDPLAADARRYSDALSRWHHQVRLVVVTPAGDQGMLSPRTEEGLTTVHETVSTATHCRRGSSSRQPIRDGRRV
jgi:acetyl esterase/lipase